MYHCDKMKHKVECEDNITSMKDRLLNAAKTGDVALIRSLLDCEVVGIKTTKDGSTLTPLCISAQHGHLAAVLYLLKEESDADLVDVSHQALPLAKNEEIRRAILEEPTRRLNEVVEIAAKKSVAATDTNLKKSAGGAAVVDKKKCPRCQSGGLCRTCPSSAAKIKFKTITKSKRKIAPLSAGATPIDAGTRPSDNVTDTKMSGKEYLEEEDEEYDDEGDEDEDDDEEEDIPGEDGGANASQTVATVPKVKDPSIVTENQPRKRSTGKLVSTALVKSRSSAKGCLSAAAAGKPQKTGSEGPKKVVIDIGTTKETAGDVYDDDAAEDEKLVCPACGFLNPVPFLHPICGVCEGPLDSAQPPSREWKIGVAPAMSVPDREAGSALSPSSEREAAAGKGGKGKALFRSTSTPRPSGWSEWTCPPVEADQKVVTPPKTWNIMPSPPPQSNLTALTQSPQSTPTDVPKTWKSLVQPQREPAAQGQRAFPPLAPVGPGPLDLGHSLPPPPLSHEYLELCDRMHELRTQG